MVYKDPGEYNDFNTYSVWTSLVTVPMGRWTLINAKTEPVALIVLFIPNEMILIS